MHKPKLSTNIRLHIYKFLNQDQLVLAGLLNKRELHNHVLTSQVIDSRRSLTISASEGPSSPFDVN